MKTKRRGSVLLVVAVLMSPMVSLDVHGDEKRAEPEAMPRVAELGWLEGRWVGAMGEAVIEEHWSAPEGNTIIGMFRLVKAPAEGGDPGAARIGFSEFWTVEPGPKGPRLLLRHFGPGLVGWEDKEAPLVFEPIAAGERSITWEVDKPEGTVRLAYRSPDPDTLIAELQEPDGSTPTFTYKRAK